MTVEYEITGHTRFGGLLGYPVAHSISPQMHNYSFRRLGIDAVYLCFSVQPEQLGETVRTFRNLDCFGFNLTMPDKTAMLEYLDELSPAARMIGTMNYGYAGTRELNEALVSRFLVIDMPPLTEETLFYLMQSKFPDLKPAARDALAGLYLDLQKKAKQAEITTRALDLRGLFGAIGTMRQGLSPYLAVQIGIVNKCFDLFEKEIVRDVVRTRIPEEWTPQDVF